MMREEFRRSELLLGPQALERLAARTRRCSAWAV